MAVGPGGLPDFYPIAGVRIGIASAGIKKPGRKDVVVFELAPGSQVAGIFTRNQFCAAPVVLSRRHLAQAAPRYLLINTGNANAGTGEQGLRDALACCQALADKAGVTAEEVLPFSTGVIGEPLPVAKIVAALDDALAEVSESRWPEAAEGIMTTDTRPKGASRQVRLGEHTVSISGISKGAGMIRPNMATMLGFIATDARIEPGLLQSLASELGEASFNRITVDGDTSTNDACMLVATGQYGGPEVAADSPELPVLREALKAVYLELAHAIVRDGEGATKFVTIDVRNAASQAEALDVAYAVAHSPLVKTALFASDPNWGRILAAVGRAGVSDLDLQALEIYLGDVCLVRNGGRAEDYSEARGQAVMNQEEVTITIDLRRGEVRETVWTCDFSHDYVTINAEYRT
ncbi:bifunctional glutamate N-acetyltransferase/amino-acid acetyltransferase ArgJ [Marinobacter lutaoensis]|jgi:glutamate N-acetyltransferase/amino-acid N-acetyltransferase|uniref:Arginine biosynthesis bifunctional protein ArgJ n=1 Tax=Marinobacter lutaoensis TaxID=135739 RepID=A0A1V2DQN0_9GAMM|nr:bifunctional glutamate N-acetyltransferase/amino-acid acetyltransferase ArgJ [Marinobacter lutaoensis]MBE02051.1 bifunctional ornithine acetyltransferase/N-acetylglutamate synthase [Marinobacter sp.]MBI43565.1 bifunctional ornithine acetyltransferase/N-acetylglutamate synthase [Oceanospirillales bacterium]NVD35295.1 bifunctional glutamate N-acetyltransferase/amino-acid acetyltransferase ArgJ [Marinobacter lutaoensis]ONF42676.1 bifunctional ornithine acetyltransferase/N-acetylglutamate syntha|tara:strand:- start:369 stop:1586 length:1218 start_codon:yes stop_codon:yes gene_type:complete